jgi:hypothetical protein
VRLFKINPRRIYHDKAKEPSSENQMPVVDHGMTAPTLSIRIFSGAIINALQSVVKYYPAQDLTGDTIGVMWPYPILVHHYDELKDFARDCESKDPEILCERERDAGAHLKLLLDYLDSTVMEMVRAEQERNRKGFYTFEGYWVGMKPGTIVATRYFEDKRERGAIVHSLGGGIFDHPPVEWDVTFWSLEFDGTFLERKTNDRVVVKFDGEMPVSIEDSAVPVGFGDHFYEKHPDNDLVEKRVRQGEQYWNLLQKQCKYYNGTLAQFPYTKVRLRYLIFHINWQC